MARSAIRHIEPLLPTGGPKAVVPANISATSTCGGTISKAPKLVTPTTINAKAKVYGWLPLKKQSVTLTRHLSDGAVLVPDRGLFSLTFNTNYIYKWPDPGDLATYETFQLDSFRVSPSSLVYSAANDRLYGGVTVQNNVDITVYAIDPNNISVGSGTILLDYTAGVSGTDLFSTNSAIAVDDTGTYIYIALQNVLANSFVLKVRISDGVVVASIQLTNPPTGDSKNATNIRIGSDGNIYVTGQVGTGWIAKLPNDLSTITSIVNFSQQMSAVDDDSVEIGSYIWYGYEGAAGNGRLCRVAKSDLSQTYMQTGTGQGVDGMDYDGTYLYVGHLGNPGKISRVDPSSMTVDRTWSLTTGENPINEIFKVANGFVILTYENLSRAIFLPVGPMQPVGTAAISATSTMSGAITTGPGVKAITPAAINATSTVSGSIRVTRRITPAQISATSTVSGVVVRRVAIIAAQIAATATVSGAIRVRRAITPAQISATSTVTAAIGVRRKITPAQISATSTVAGSVARIIRIAGVVNATSTVSGAVGVIRRLVAAVISATSTVSGLVGRRRPIVAAVIAATATVSGSIRALRRISPAQIAATSTVSAILGFRRPITPGQISATSTVSGFVSRAGKISGQVLATSTVTGAVIVIRAVRPANITATSTVSGLVGRRRPIVSAQVNATSTVAGTIRVIRRVSPAQISAISTLTVSLRVTRRIAPSVILASSSVAGSVGRAGFIGGIVNATSTVSGAVIVLRRVSGLISATSLVSGSIKKIDYIIPAQISATSTVSGRIVVRRRVSGVILATSLVSATLTRISGVSPGTEFFSVGLPTPVIVSAGFDEAESLQAVGNTPTIRRVN